MKAKPLIACFDSFTLFSLYSSLPPTPCLIGPFLFFLVLLARHHTYSLACVVCAGVGKMRRGVFSNLALGANCGVAQKSVFAVCLLSPHEHLPLTDACARHLQVFASLLKHKNASFFSETFLVLARPPLIAAETDVCKADSQEQLKSNKNVSYPIFFHFPSALTAFICPIGAQVYLSPAGGEAFGRRRCFFLASNRPIHINSKRRGAKTAPGAVSDFAFAP